MTRLAGVELAEAGVQLDLGEEVATVTLNRPERLNAQTPRSWRALAEIGRQLPGTIRVVVVRGAGRAFSAGLDRAFLDPRAASTTAADASATAEPGADLPTSLADIARMGDAGDAVIDSFQAGFRWLRRPDLISVAAVQGHAIGAGFQLALACDLRIAAEDAQFQMAEVGLGLVPDLGGTAPLLAAVGYPRALEICLTGRRVGAAEAGRIGLVNLVVPLPQLEEATADLVAAVRAAPRGAVTELKALLASADGRGRSEQEAAERAAQLRRLAELAGLVVD